MKIFGIGFNRPKQMPAQTTKKVQDLLLRMNSKTATVENNPNMLLGLRTKTGKLVDLSCITRPVPSIWEGRAKVTFDNLDLEINPKDGKILHSEKSIFLTWKKAFKKVEKLMDDMQYNFDIPFLVDKKFLTVITFSKEQIEKLQQATSRIHS